MIGDRVERFSRGIDWVEMSQVDLAAAREGDVLADPHRIARSRDIDESRDGCFVHRAGCAEGEAESMQKNRVTLSQFAQAIGAAVEKMFRGDFEASHLRRVRVDPRRQRMS